MEKYEKIQKENVKLLNTFEKCLSTRNLSKKIIKKHINNVDLFINQYLAIDEEESPEELTEYTLDFFFRWCIDKWIFNTALELNSAIYSIQLFYEHLNENKPLPNIEKIRNVCAKKEQYIKKFNSHEKLLKM